MPARWNWSWSRPGAEVVTEAATVDVDIDDDAVTEGSDDPQADSETHRCDGADDAESVTALHPCAPPSGWPDRASVSTSTTSTTPAPAQVSGANHKLVAGSGQQAGRPNARSGEPLCARSRHSGGRSPLAERRGRGTDEVSGKRDVATERAEPAMTSRICEHCGIALADVGKFCPGCGAATSAPSPARNSGIVGAADRCRRRRRRHPFPSESDRNGEGWSLCWCSAWWASSLLS